MTHLMPQPKTVSRAIEAMQAAIDRNKYGTIEQQKDIRRLQQIKEVGVAVGLVLPGGQHNAPKARWQLGSSDR